MRSIFTPLSTESPIWMSVRSRGSGEGFVCKKPDLNKPFLPRMEPPKGPTKLTVL